MIVQRFPFRSLEEAKDIPAFHFVSALSYKRLIQCKCGLFFCLISRISLQTLLGDVALQSLLKIEPRRLELTRMRPKNVGILALHQV